MTFRALLENLIKLLAVSALAVSVVACGGDGGSSTPPDDDTPPADGDDDVPPPVEDDDEIEFEHGAPGELLLLEPEGNLGSARFNGVFGVTDDSVVAPGIRFPLETGPAFLNSQIFGYGGGGYDYGGGEVYENPNVGQENDARNFEYPWYDNFCEVRSHTLGMCEAGVGHQGQDIRPATCENGAFFAVAPEDGYVRRVGETHLLEIYGDSGLVYKYLHLDRPLEPGIELNERVTRGQRLGKISNKTGATSRSTTVHLHFEIWHGTASGGVNTGAGPLPPYTSLVEAYLDLIEEHPDQFDPVPPPSDVQECREP